MIICNKCHTSLKFIGSIRDSKGKLILTYYCLKCKKTLYIKNE